MGVKLVDKYPAEQSLANILHEYKSNRGSAYNILVDLVKLEAYYFYLNELYGGVPLITRMLTLGESQTPRSTKEEVTDFIITELDAAKPFLLAEPTSSNKGRVNVGAALALKSRVALYNERWEVAASAAKEVIDLGAYQLHDKFDELFAYEEHCA